MAEPNRSTEQPLQGKIAVVSGGSKGIGLATAAEFVRLGGRVALIARGEEALEDAARQLRALLPNGEPVLELIACDATDQDALKPRLEALVAAHGVPDYLFNVVGYAYPQYLEKLTLADFRQNMEVNYFGQLVPILILLPHFMKARKGHIANVSSMMGYFGIAGYATYAPTKFAIVGLTEVLRNELKPHGITFSILYPPDTDTPGFETENLTKPEETAIMSEGAKLMTQEAVAKAFLEGVLKKRYHILPGDARLAWLIQRHAPGLMRQIIDRDYQKARQRLGKS